jgi:hypothetical protein
MGPTRNLSGFGLDFVGLNVGKFELPDMDHQSRINSLDAKCRVCRVLIGEESSWEIQRYEDEKRVTVRAGSYPCWAAPLTRFQPRARWPARKHAFRVS